MKKSTQIILVCIGILNIVAAVVVGNHFMDGKDVVLTVVTAMLAFNFFMYKLLAGWLIVNMTVKIEGTRQPVSKDSKKDHLALKVTLTKGSIDSVWVDKIEIRLKQLAGGSPAGKILVPLNMEKLGDLDGNYWAGDKSTFYTISSGEEAVFSAYAAVPADTVISAELLVLGTRLFYGIESTRDKRIQWRSSTVFLPYADKN